MAGPENYLESLRERIDASDEISPADRDILRAFDDQLTLLGSSYSAYRRAKLLRHCTIMAEEVGGLADALTDRGVAEELVRWINRNYDNEETNRDYRVALRVFGRHATDENGDEPPDALTWVPSTTSSNYDPAPRPGDMLDWHEDVLPMIEATENPRDAAAIALQFDAGLRGFEFTDLAVGDVSDHPHGLQVTVDGKQGRRTVLLVPSVPYVREWLDEYPEPAKQDAPLWSRLESAEGVSYQMIRKIFSRAAEQAGVGKPVTLTNFRKSSASYHASKGLSQAHLENRYGWVTGSSAASRYIKIFAKEADDAIAKLHGLEVEEDETEHIGPIPCPRCGFREKREARFCSRCGQAMDVEAASGIEAAQEKIVESYKQVDPEDTETIGKLEALDAIIDNPEELTPEQVELLSQLLD